jgi:uncharacterized protein YjbI with pentapeptide repeats
LADGRRKRITEANPSPPRPLHVGALAVSVSSDDETEHRDDRPGWRGRALQNADFAGADLRGADFTGADLTSASFRDAEIGVRPRVGVALLGGAMIVAICAGLAIGWAVSDTRGQFSADNWDEVAQGGTVTAVMVVLVVMMLWRGFDLAIKVVAVVYVALLVVNVIANLIWDEVEWLVAARATALVVFLVAAVCAGILGRLIGGVFGSWSIALVAALGGLASGRADGGGGAVLVAVCLVIISKRAVRGDPRDRTLRRVAHRVVRRWGTQFVDADLTGADFTGTDPSGSDVRGATLVDVTWDLDYPAPVDIGDRSRPRQL